MIDLYGHFGSRLSYATIAYQLAYELRDRGQLGRVSNFDDRFVDESIAPPPAGVGNAALLLSDPEPHLIDALVSQYGRERVAIFVCPNTSRLSDDRVYVCQSVGRIYTPSNWCQLVIGDSLSSNRAAKSFQPGGSPEVMVQPLGVDEPFTSKWVRSYRAASVRMLHVTTDTFWPGRKGTEELLKAWRLVRTEFAMEKVPLSLTVHCLPRLYGVLHQELGDLGLLGDVQVLMPDGRGTDSADLCKLISEHDLLVAPSRSEGFGIMPLSALMVGTPVVTTANTGQSEYLDERRKLSGWVQVPTYGVDGLVGEDGEAPVVRADQLAISLLSAARLVNSLHDQIQPNRFHQTTWSWKTRRAEWIDSLMELNGERP